MVECNTNRYTFLIENIETVLMFVFKSKKCIINGSFVVGQSKDFSAKSRFELSWRIKDGTNRVLQG
jgi:hypothetical protein